jgi:hypothetical protein
MNKELLGIVSNSTTQCNFVGNTAIAQSLKTFLSTPVRRFSFLRVILKRRITLRKMPHVGTARAKPLGQ